LRLDEGVSQAEFLRRYGVPMTSVYGDTFRDLLGKGLLEERGERYRIPDAYWPVANVIFEKFVTAASVD
jgi:oxygen-independent coproporphyrinogen III oxidase